MAEIYLALGSNVGDSRAYLTKAVELLSKKITNITLAPIYSSKAVGYTEQSDFMNTALHGHTVLSPHDLLDFTQQTEQTVGRIRRFRWGPREIDVDIIFYDHQIINEPNLHIPHPSFSERDFVLKPLCKLAPDFIDPLTKQTLEALLSKLPTSELSIQSEIGSKRSQ